MDVYEFIIAGASIMLIGIPLTVFVFCVRKRLKEISILKQLQGELYISDEGAYSVFFIPIEELKKKKYILLEVKDVTAEVERHTGIVKAEIIAEAKKKQAL